MSHYALWEDSQYRDSIEKVEGLFPWAPYDSPERTLRMEIEVMVRKFYTDRLTLVSRR